MDRQQADLERFDFVFVVSPVCVCVCVCVCESACVWRWVGSGGLLIQLNEPVKVIKALGQQEEVDYIDYNGSEYT